MDPILPIAIDFTAHCDRTLVDQLHLQLQAAILDGRLAPGMQLPPSRKLAAALVVSRNTVVNALDLLLSQGYLIGRQGAGTFVAERIPRRHEPPKETDGDRQALIQPFWLDAARSLTGGDATVRRYDFRAGLPERALFPIHVWRRLSQRAFLITSREPSVAEHPQGRERLRCAIAAHLSFTRGIACSSEDVVVTAGAQQAFDLIARILVKAGLTSVAVEDPGYPSARLPFEAAGARVIPGRVDEEGLVVAELPPAIDIVIVTPSHQFPLGVAMSQRRRLELLDYARRHGAVIVEDDYDGEFRFVGKPLDALCSVDDRSTVFYVGTFSKSMTPDIRLGFVLPPAWARDALTAARQIADGNSPPAVQDALASFMEEGHLARYVRKMRNVYRLRRVALIDALQRHAGERLRAIPCDTGLHLAVRLSSGDAQATADAAASLDVGVTALSRFALKADVQGFAMGIGLIAEEDVEAGVARFCRALQV